MRQRLHTSSTLTSRGLVALTTALIGAACSDDKGTTDPSGDVSPDVSADADTGPDDTSADSAVPENDADTSPDTTLTDTQEVAPEDADTTIDITPPDTTPPIPDADVVADNSLCSPAGGSLNIYDLQNRDCPDHPMPEPVGTNGIEVSLTGVIVTGTFGDTWTVQDARGGPYSGLTVFNHGLMSATVKVGDVLDLVGNYSEYFENTQVYLTSAEIVGQATVPDPFVPEHPAHLATNGQLAEMFEGVLVRVDDVKTIHTQPDCPFDYGEFEVTGGLRIDDMGFEWKANDACTRTCARLGDSFASITGPLLFTFGNHKIEPRTADDVVFTAKGGVNAVSKCVAAECRAREDAIVTREVVINEIMADPFGDDTHREWIELYNPSNEAVNLNGWVVRDCGDQEFTLIGADAVIGPRDYLVLGMTKDRSLNGDTPVDFEYGVEGFYLPNTIGSVLLYDGPTPQARLIDQARYSRFEDWTDTFRSGRSIERVSPSSDGTQVDAWESGSGGFGDNGDKGSPGRSNSSN
jgi:hypothetical protein